MAVKKLMANSCYIMEAAAPVEASPNSEVGMASAAPPPPPVAPSPLAVLDRPGILVHEGDFDSSDGPISFNRARLERVARKMNELRSILLAEYKGFAPDGAWPPLLDHHDGDKNSDTIGRLMGQFSVELRFVPKIGKTLWCLVNDQLRFLGADTCARVLDGRIFNLSVGIDEETDLLTETSTVIVPAAWGAHVLSGKKKLSTPLVPAAQLNKNEPTGVTMPKALATKRLAAAKARSAALKQLVSDSDGVTQLAAANKGKIVHMVAEANVTKRLRGLIASGKMTPAHYKSLDIKKLAGLDKSALDICMHALEAGEPVIMPGQIGTKDATDGTEVRAGLEKQQITRLKKEAREDMRLVPRPSKSVKRLAAGEADAEKDEKELSGKEGEDKGEKKELSFEQRVDKKMASGDENPAKKDLAGAEDVTKALASGEDYERALLSIQEQLDAQSIQIAKIGDAVKKMLVEEEAEMANLEAEEGAAEGTAGAEGGTELGADGKPKPKELAGAPGEGVAALAGDKPKDEKTLAAGEAGDKEKELAAAGADGAKDKKPEGDKK